jgi:hypothetical protein|tara:strand:+ start:1591 stop:2223 length:633 start_codon:yes stop_codon:yes gene_type:complete
MAYREIDESEVAIDAPITHTLITTLRDNLEAIRTGDSTAPRTTAGSPSSDSVLNRAIFKRNTPSAGVYCIWQASAVADADDSNVIQVYINTEGRYRYRLNARCGSTEQENSGDNKPPVGEANINVYRTVGASTTLLSSNTIKSQTTYGGDAADAATGHLKLDFIPSTQAVGEIITIEVDEVLQAQVLVNLQVGTSDSEAMYGVDVRGLLT